MHLVAYSKRWTAAGLGGFPRVCRARREAGATGRTGGESGDDGPGTGAQSLFAARLAELAGAGENDTRAEAPRKKPTIAEVVKEHLDAPGRERGVTPGWLEATGVFLGRAVTFFGSDRRLGAISEERVLDWIEWLRQLKTSRGRPLSEGSIRHHPNTLSKLYARAQRRRYVAPGYNPVRQLSPEERPAVPETSTRCFEVPEAALILEAART